MSEKIGSVLGVLFFMLVAFLVGMALVVWKGIEASQALVYAGIGIGIIVLIGMLLGGLRLPSILKA